MRKVEFRKDCSLSFRTKHPVRKVELRMDCSLQFSDKTIDEKGGVGEGLSIAVFWQVKWWCVAGVRQSRHPPDSAEVCRHLQRHRGDSAAGSVVLGSDGRVHHCRAVPVPALCVGTHAPASHHCRLPRQGLCAAGKGRISM